MEGRWSRGSVAAESQIRTAIRTVMWTVKIAAQLIQISASRVFVAVVSLIRMGIRMVLQTAMISAQRILSKLKRGSADVTSATLIKTEMGSLAA